MHRARCLPWWFVNKFNIKCSVPGLWHIWVSAATICSDSFRNCRSLVYDFGRCNFVTRLATQLATRLASLATRYMTRDGTRHGTLLATLLVARLATRLATWLPRSVGSIGSWAISRCLTSWRLFPATYYISIVIASVPWVCNSWPGSPQNSLYLTGDIFGSFPKTICGDSSRNCVESIHSLSWI